jgi:hypothetical protein
MIAAIMRACKPALKKITGAFVIVFECTKQPLFISSGRVKNLRLWWQKFVMAGLDLFK